MFAGNGCQQMEGKKMTLEEAKNLIQRQMVKRFQIILKRAEQLQDMSLLQKEKDGDVFDQCEGFAYDINHAATVAIESLEKSLVLIKSKNNRFGDRR